MDPYALSTLLRKPYIPSVLCSDSFLRVMHDDSPYHSWFPRGNRHTDVGTSRASANSRYASNYVDYLIGGRSSGFPDDQ